MAKILLVEDDNNLREIYGARLTAEGYQIVAAPDGEEALALAVKEKPDLIITDVMMPKISGFDMLDILRNAPETKNTKVIMMTALSQAEDKERADKLGADLYLVKSQVTLEDVAASVRKILESDGGSSENTEAPAAPQTEAPEATPPPSEPPKEPEAVTPAPAPAPQPPAATTAPVAPPVVIPEEPVAPVPAPVSAQPANPVAAVNPAPNPPATPIPTPVDDSNPAPVQTVSAPTAPVQTDSQASSSPISVSEPPKEPETVTPAPVAPVPAPEPPKPTAKKIEVILPDSPDEKEKPDEKPKEETAPAPASTPAVETPAIESAAAGPDVDPSLSIGPNLAEALAEEEKVAPIAPKSAVPEAQDKTSEAVAAVTSSDPSSVIKPQAVSAPEPEEDTTPPKPAEPKAVGGERVIQPINDPAQKTDLNELLAQEEAKQTGATLPPNSLQTPPQPQTPDHPDDLSKISL